MAAFGLSLSCLNFVEFDGIPSRALEYSGNENFLTYCGINKRDEPNFNGWSIIGSYLQCVQGGLPLVSEACFNDIKLTQDVYDYYLSHIWKPICGFSIKRQSSANRIFTMCALVSLKVGVQLAQVSCGSTPDGSLGVHTLERIDNCLTFDDDFDTVCSIFLKNKALLNPALVDNNIGWQNRIVKVDNFSRGIV